MKQITKYVDERQLISSTVSVEVRFYFQPSRK